MKILLPVVLYFILINNLFAQSTVESLQLNRNFLVNSAGLPEEFLLFAPDSAAGVLFNPARGNNFKDNFIYINYFSDYTNSYYSTVNIPFPFVNNGVFYFPALNKETFTSQNPTFSIASLFKAGSIKWLLTFSNGVNSNEIQNSTLDNSERISTPIDESRNLSLLNYLNYIKQDQTLTTLKLSGIWGNKTSSYSLGIFGILLSDNYYLTRNYYSPGYRINASIDTLIIRSYSLTADNGKEDEKIKKYAAGIEFSINTDHLDYVGSATYQKSIIPQNFIDNYSFIQYDSLSAVDPVQWQVSGHNYIMGVNGNISGNLNGISSNNYFRYKTDLFMQDDNIFFSFNGYYISGDRNFNRYVNRITKDINQNAATIDTANDDISGILNNKSWNVNLSAGYAAVFPLDDINILSGLRLKGSYGNLENASGNLSSGYSASMITSKDKNSYFMITLPLYINFSPEKWISVYGGINYSYYYLYQKSEDNNSYISISNYSYIVKENENYYQKTSQWQSAKSIYVGCELRHKSGLRIQFFFDNDITLVRSWNISVGYHF